MIDEILVFSLGTLILTALALIWATRPQLHIVAEEERLVVYRFGKFHRLAGPGPVWVRRRIDQIERTLQVREEPHYLKFNGLYAYDIPIGYTLSLWYKLDPVAAAEGDQHMLRKLVQFDSEECNENIRIRIHDLFIKHIADAMRSQTLSSSPTVLDKLIPFCPGQAACDEMISKIRRELPELLRSFGAVFNPSQPVAIKDFHLDSSIVQLLDRDRVIGGFLQRVPNGDPDLLTQATIALEGVQTQALSKIVLAQNGSAQNGSALNGAALNGSVQNGSAQAGHLEESIPLDSILAEQLAAQATIPTQRQPNRQRPAHPEPIAGHRNVPLRQESLLVAS